MVVWMALWVGCTPPPETPGNPTDRTDGATDTTDNPTDTNATDSTVTPTGTTGATGDTAEELDCTVLPPTQPAFQTMMQFDTAEDFDFDGDGYLCSIDNQNLRCRDLTGDVKLIAPSVTQLSAGTRMLITEDWVVADVGSGAVILVDGVTGGTSAIATGLQYPNGMEVDTDNMVYVAENSGTRVRQVDAYTGEQWVVAEGLNQPNGVILSPDGNTLYVGSFGGGMVYAIDRLGPTEWAEERILYQAGQNGGFDGINVDACGNVYITEFTVGRIYRFTPDGVQAEILIDLPSGWIPNMRWGSGIGGWRTDVLYVTAFDRLYALDMGIEGKKHVLVP